MTAIDARERRDLEDQRGAPLLTPTDLGPAARHDVAAALNAILADVFALYPKTRQPD